MENLIISFILGLSVMFFGMTAWLFFRREGRLIIDYFIYRHEAVMESLGAGRPETEETPAEVPVLSELGVRIERLFNEDHVFLNPDLKI